MKERFFEYICENFDITGSEYLIGNILDWVWEQSMDREDTIEALMCLFDGTGIEREEIKSFIDW